MRALLTLAFVVPVLAAAQVTIDNVEPGEIVRHPVIILEGSAQDDTIAIGGDWKTAGRFPVVNHRYVGFAELKPGKNMVVLQSGKHILRYLLEYKPMATPYKVVTLFVKAKDGKDEYYTNHLGDKFPIREKLDVAMKLLQAACAESMFRQGYGRKTFNLELEKDGKVKVHFVTLPKTTDEMRAMKDMDSWFYMYDQIKPLFDEETTRWCGMLGWTRFNRIEGKNEGHMALGGGAQAMFGGASMGWWPESFKEVPVKFADTYVIDPTLMFEDSARRGTVWANVSTALGAMLHEMGHTFGLPHSADRYSVMSRGFDYFNRWFSAIEPPAKNESQSKFPTLEERMRWDKFSAARLNLNPFFQSDAKKAPAGEAPKITIANGTVTIESSVGLKLWGADRDDTPAVFEELKNAPKKVELNVDDLRKRLGTDKPFRITAIDGNGRQTVFDTP
jgi:hypothetical protein